jgi:hypothetical protein
MALLSGLIRTVAITGRTDTVNAWFAGRQGGPWAEQKVRAAFPRVGPQASQAPPAASTRVPADPARTVRDLADLHQRGVLTDDEFATLRAGLSD